MKVSTLSALYNALTSFGYDNTEAMAELYAEIHKGDKVKAEKAALYEDAKPIVFRLFALTDKPLTVAEIWENIEDKVPDGFTKAKLSYALTHQWAGEVTKAEGKVNAYRANA